MEGFDFTYQVFCDYHTWTKNMMKRTRVLNFKVQKMTSHKNDLNDRQILNLTEQKELFQKDLKTL